MTDEGAGREPSERNPGPERTLPPDSAGTSAPTEEALATLDALWAGRILAGRYALGKVIGRGGMGVVFEGQHLSLGRSVAVKLLHSDLARSADAVERFHREARAAAAIGNEHIVEVLDFGHGAECGAYLVMERLVGEDLAARLERHGPLEVSQALEFARQICSALASAHDKGIVHRDLKSGNVFLSVTAGAERVKVLDWGISKVLDEGDRSAPITRDGVMLGTPRYMAPEQCTDGAKIDHRADLYALGCILYEMLTGCVPFTGTSSMEVLYKHTHSPAPKLSDALPTHRFDSRLEALIQTLLAKDRRDRYPDARSVIVALDTLRLPRRRSRLPTVFLSFALALALGVTTAVVISHWAPPVQPAPPRASNHPSPPAPSPQRVDTVLSEHAFTVTPTSRPIAAPVARPEPSLPRALLPQRRHTAQPRRSGHPTETTQSSNRAPPAGLLANPYD